MEQALNQSVYGVGVVVPESGMYVCTSCGFVQYYEKGSLFVPCPSCSAGSEDGPTGFEEDADFWQRAE